MERTGATHQAQASVDGIVRPGPPVRRSRDYASGYPSDRPSPAQASEPAPGAACHLEAARPLNTRERAVEAVRAAQPTEWPLRVSRKRRKLRLRFGGISSWHEFRLFTAGSLLSLGLLAIGFYAGLSRPSSSAKNALGPAVVAADDGSVIELDEGVAADDIDTRPSMPVTGTVPKTLRVGAIGVDAPIRSLGLTRSGALAVPPVLWQVGWYDQSARPGRPGTVVLDGHYNGNGYAVFRDLHKLKAGDEIVIENGEGDSFTYAVESIEVYGKDNIPMERVIASDGSERLNIITCNGTWVGSESTYDKRLVVYAKRV